MKPYVIPVLLLLLAPAANAQVVIHQVLYDPLTESGGEAIELHNPTNQDINISGWAVQTETSLTDAIIPDGTVLRGGAYYLIADEGWSETNPTWRAADHEEAITLTNTNAGVALSSGTDTIDAVGWGDASEIDIGLYEGQPHMGASEGNALLREQDTNSNDADFIEASPRFSETVQDSTIDVTITVGGELPEVSALTIEDHDAREGVQLRPHPGEETLITVNASITHASGIESVRTVTFTFLNATHPVKEIHATSDTSATLTYDLPLPYTVPPAEYPLELTITDANGLLVTHTVPVEVQGVIALQTSTSSLTFSLNNGESATSEVEIVNRGNVPFDLELSSTNFNSDTDVIAANALEYTIGSSTSTLSTIPTLIELQLQSSASLPIEFSLTLPPTTKPGQYRGTISLTARP